MTQEGEFKGFQKFLALYLIGFFIIIVGVVLIAVAAILSDKPASFGAFIFIGPFPFVFGAGPEASWMVLLAVILAILSVVMLLILYRKTAEKTNT